jgi:hypothetical protein
MILLVGFYQDADPARTAEFVECVRRNAANPHLERIAVFLEDRVPAHEIRTRFPVFSDPKLQLIEHGRRLTFQQLFDHANRHLAGSGVILANTDIWFDETLARLEEETLSGRLLCLSRWEQAPDGRRWHYDMPCSQDAWIFEPPVPPFRADFPLGKPGCENRLAYEAQRAGLTVTNPSRSLHAWHLHNSGVRRYTPQERIHGPLRLVPASFLTAAAEGTAPCRPPFETFPSHRGWRARLLADTRCREIESALSPFFEGSIPRELRRALLRAIGARVDGPPRPVDRPLATVAFRERMGYTLATLETGVSTHNNDRRPVIALPAALAGLRFTQVVSCQSAPVEIEFRSAGRLYVLAAPGWEGYASAVAFLDDAGWREPMDPLRTATGTVFEPWSLAGEAGERLVVPTQVMLASAELLRLADCAVRGIHHADPSPYPSPHPMGRECPEGG